MFEVRLIDSDTEDILRVIGYSDTKEGACKIFQADEEVKRQNCFYLRMWEPREGTERYDYGSWSKYVDVVEVE